MNGAESRVKGSPDRRRSAVGLLAVLWLSVLLGMFQTGQCEDDLARIKPNLRTGFGNGGWKYDRYKDLESLDAHTRMTVADIEGPGVIRHIHTTRHHPKELMARGIVLEVWFDDAKRPAVMCPLADFFGDGCNGDSTFFTSKLVECAPWSYNCYFPMPFRSRARVILRNDTDKNAMNYAYVEWENLPEWKDDLGYFHATYRRKCFQLTKDTDETFFEVEGCGHLIGRQYSVVTEEPVFRAFHFVMEGNNEVDVDGQARRLDYLGTEDSFTFSWGFQNTFAGLRAGMPLVEHGARNRLSIYRFHDYMPIRFNKSLRWQINWTQEHGFHKSPKLLKAAAENGCWVDYATVHYWYQKDPGGFEHEPLRPLDERSKPTLHPQATPVDVGAILDSMQADPRLENTFATEEDMRRVHVRDAYEDTHPFWIDEPQPKGGHPGNPNPGKRGILAVHAKNERVPCLIVRRVAVPAEKDSLLRIVTSGDPYEIPGQSDFLLQVGVHDGKGIRWFEEKTIDAGSLPSAENWQTLQYGLEDYAGKTIGVVLKVSYGGANAAQNEEAFFDEISVVSQ